MKYILCTFAAAMICSVAHVGQAADGIPAGSLRQMGLSGLVVMSDDEGLAVRGQGAFAGGISWAIIGQNPGDIDLFPGAGSINAYGARGKYEASGTNGSIAGRARISIKHVQHSDGTQSSTTRIRSVIVGAGGFSSAKAF